MDFSCPNPAKTISEDAYHKAAEELECDIAAIKAVAEVESKRAPFDDEGRPTILYERHKFRSFTGRRFDRSHPVLSGPAGNYGKFSEQWPKLTDALALDEEAALKSVSWGQFQIMGFNHALAGYSDVESFVEALVANVDNHLDAFVDFVLNANLDGHLRSLNWRKFALGYNGTNYRQNAYDQKMAAAYQRYAAEPSAPAKPSAAPAPDGFEIRTVRDLQRALQYLAIDPGIVDNKMGPKTTAAITKFQRFAKLAPTGQFTLEVRSAVQAAYHMMRQFEAAQSAEA
ncbi:N-acetylmuramidase domain-containing protein [Poseidonocella sp. HB161398]|uniref:N-acetylmuramidase domain-containing protein n=1 Tax=Poseidonocella sp. HB161398 TaxID=2320855 RepID=UPI00148664EA|nr:N-acetylmuramidase domain-containing protein [Poseidonocella sp. HB161398]